MHILKLILYVCFFSCVDILHFHSYTFKTYFHLFIYYTWLCITCSSNWFISIGIQWDWNRAVSVCVFFWKQWITNRPSGYKCAITTKPLIKGKNPPSPNQQFQFKHFFPLLAKKKLNEHLATKPFNNAK